MLSFLPLLLLLLSASSFLHYSPRNGAHLRSTKGAIDFAGFHIPVFPSDEDDFVDYLIGQFLVETLKQSVLDGDSHVTTPSSPWIIAPETTRTREQLRSRIIELMTPHLQGAFRESQPLSAKFGISPNLSFDRPSSELESVKRLISDYMISAALKTSLDDPERLATILELLDRPS